MDPERAGEDDDFEDDSHESDAGSEMTDPESESEIDPGEAYIDHLCRLEKLDKLFKPSKASTSQQHNLDQVVLKDRVGESLPEAVIWKILMRLPVAAQCRFRCVCKIWKGLLSAPSSTSVQNDSEGADSGPSCTIMCSAGHYEASFFSHSEDKWFQMPFKPISCLALPWEIEDVDGGLVCYRCVIEKRMWLCITNPIIQSFQVLPPPMDPEGLGWRGGFEYAVAVKKFFVDRETKKFKVVVVQGGATLVYDSNPQSWKIFQSCPTVSIDKRSIFVWKNVIYGRRFQSSTFAAFDTESGIWTEVKADLPCDTKEKYFITTSKDHVMLVQLMPRQVEPVSVWALVETETDASTLSASRWEKLPVEESIPLRDLVGEVEACISHVNEYICLMTGSTHHWMKYTFRTKTWRSMPCRGRTESRNNGMSGRIYRWFDWEPRLDMKVTLGGFKESDYPDLAAFQKSYGPVDLPDYRDVMEQEEQAMLASAPWGGDLDQHLYSKDGSSDDSEGYCFDDY